MLMYCQNKKYGEQLLYRLYKRLYKPFYCFKITNLFLTLIAFFFISCSETPQQYEQPSDVNEPDPVEHPITPVLATEATHPKGGYLLYQKQAVTTEATKDVSTRENSLVPINYQNDSVANISLETIYEEAQEILNFDFISQQGNRAYHIYKEGIIVMWRNDAPRTPDVIYIMTSYQGTMDFGPWMGENRHIKMGQSFADQFSEGEKYKDIFEDPKARHFITSLYKYLENTEEDCLETQSCSLSINPQGNYVLFQFAKMVFLFGNDSRRNLVQIAMSKDDDPACFKSPFDILTAQFFCEQEDSSKITFGLGDNSKAVIEKAGVNPNLPITYMNNLLLQRTKATSIAWKRNNFKEKVEAIPDTTHLSLAYMGSNQYNIPFLLNQSLIKISLGEGNTVQLTLESLVEEEKQWTMQDISKKLQTTEADSSGFYLSTEMPQIKGNITVQKNLIKALLDLLEETYTNFYSSESSELKIYKKIFGEYDDKFALNAMGFLIVSNPTGVPDDFLTKYPLEILVSIDEPSGRTEFEFSLMDDDFQNHMIKTQNDLNFLQPVQEILGFKLGDKIYLRDKKPGPQTAIVAYHHTTEHPDFLHKMVTDTVAPNRKALITLANYSNEEESKAVYTSGRDKNIVFEKSEAIFFSNSASIDGTTLYILPTFQTKDIEGQLFDEYEINKITVYGNRFFGKIHSLCAIKGFDIEMGQYDRSFSETLVSQISSARQNSTDTESFEGCSYISPVDHLFSGLKRLFIFPEHQSILSSDDRELYSLTLYKKPTEHKRGEVQ